jgi:hypothetical protein
MTNLIDVLRDMNHPRLQEYIDCVAETERIVTGIDEVSEQAGQLEQLATLNIQHIHRMNELEERFKELKQQFWLAYSKQLDVRTHLVFCLRRAGYRL